VKLKIRPWKLCILLVLVCVVAMGAVEFRRRVGNTSDAALLRRLPGGDGMHVFLDVSALRDSGLLNTIAGSPAMEETEYVEFTKATGFDYRDDLHAVIASFTKERSLFVLRGRFNWDLIRTYSQDQGAKCLNGYCHLESTRGGRFVSFFPVFPTVLAVGVANDTAAAYEMLRKHDTPDSLAAPPQPFWLSLSAAYLADPGDLPPGLKAVLSALKRAKRVTLSVGADGATLDAEMRAECGSRDDASRIKDELEQVTETLKKFIARAKQSPNPRDLSGVLTAGQFEIKDHQVVGRWPIQRVFLESLASGSL